MAQLQHIQFGRWGEECACRYLAANGYSLLKRNWRYQHLEVDIIAEEYGEIIFIEVKTRTSEGFFTAKGAVDDHKKRLLSEAARHFLKAYTADTPFRFDIITIVGTPEDAELTHYKDAYAMCSKRKFTPSF